MVDAKIRRMGTGHVAAALAAVLWGVLSAAAASALTPGQRLSDLQVVAWTRDDGLLSNTLVNVHQSRDGWLWISSFSGLIRFDGVTFKNYNRTTAEVPVNGFRDILELDGEGRGPGRLLLGTQGGGLLAMDGERFSTFHPDYGNHTTVRCLWLDGEGRLWVGVNDNGAFVHESLDAEPTKVDLPSLERTTVRDITGDGESVYFATEGHGLVRLRNGAFTTWTTVTSEILNDVVTAVHAGRDGLWVGSLSGLSHLGGGGFEHVEELDGMEVVDMVEYGGSLWLATHRGIARRVSDGGVEVLPLGEIAALTFDHEGSLWAASTNRGLFQLKDRRVDVVTRADGLSSERVNVVYEAGPDELWIGTDDGTVDVLRPSSREVMRLDLPLPRTRVRDVLVDRQGRLWVATNSGLLRRARGVTRWLTTEAGFPSDLIRTVYEDRAGDVWIGTRDRGLVRAPGGGDDWEVLDQEDGLASSFVFVATEDREGRLLVGTRNTLYVLEDGRRRAYGAAEGLPGNMVFNVHVDDGGGVWLATTGGLGYLPPGGERIRSLSSDHGLPVDSVFDVVEDDRGHLWMSSQDGVFRVVRQEVLDVFDGKRSTVEPLVLDENDGMASRECTGTSRILQASDGRLWFPTLSGVAVVDPAQVVLNPIPPAVTVREVTADGVLLDLGAASGPLVLAAGTRRVELVFAALSFLAPERNRMLYRLDGLDREWRDAGTSRRTTYTSLPPGEYTFQVKAANNDGIWNSQGVTLRLRQEAFWHQRSGVRVGVALVLVVVVTGMVRWRLGAARRRQRRLEVIIARQKRAEREKEKLYAALEAKVVQVERLTYTLSHDLKSPLVTIQGFLSLLEQDYARDDRETAVKDMAQIRTAANAMQRLLEDLLELSRAGEVRGNEEEVDLAVVAREAVALVGGRIRARGVEVDVGALPVVRGDRQRLLGVFQNLVDNAVKFMGEQSSPRIEIGSRRDGEETVCYVRDNGRGIEPEHQEDVFTLFRKGAEADEGTGIGLAMVQRVVEAHGGRVWVESEGAGKGSTFYVALPRDLEPPR